MSKLDAFFKLMDDRGASDLHLISGQQPILRIDGEISRVKYKVLDNDFLRSLLYEIINKDQIKWFEDNSDLDFAYEIPGLARYRANYFEQKFGVGAVFRQIPDKILTIDQLGLPPITEKMSMLNKGLVLVTGPTGSGKSTTLAAMIDYVNKNRKDHVLTIEDPIEFVHKSQGCVINHREVGTHTKSFATALKGALREDPDIILLGEMRDLETISMALEAAATGHLVFGTLHTPSAAKTIDRIIDVFPAGQQAQIRTTLSEALRGVIAQNLFKRVDKKGRIAALEILVVTRAISNLIREEKTFQIPSAIQTGKKFGMLSLDESILEHLQAGRISSEDAYDKSIDKQRFVQFLDKPPDILG